MSSKNAGRIVLAVVVAYLLNIILIVAADVVFLKLMPPVHSVARRSYWLADVLGQSVIQTVAGYVCCWIAPAGKARSPFWQLSESLLAGFLYFIPGNTSRTGMGLLYWRFTSLVCGWDGT
jgi:hypothetical protein